MFIISIQIILGLILLTVGGEFLVRGASKLALFLGVGPLFIGLTIVSFGTSAPELVVSLSALYTDNPNIAIGNVVGSNIFNILFILGACALVLPMRITSQLIRFDLPFMMIASVVFFIFSLDKKISWIESLLLFIGLLHYLWSSLKLAKRNKNTLKEYEDEFGDKSNVKTISKNSYLLQINFIVLGLILLIIGGNQLVAGAVSLAKIFNISDTIIGLTIVAIGTSLPELATSIIAAMKGEREIAVGNLIGSNIFNICCIIGISGILTPYPLLIPEQILSFDMIWMVIGAFVCLPIFISGSTVSRCEGLFLLLSYSYYTLYLVLKSSFEHVMPFFISFSLYFLLPIACVSLLVIVFRAYKTLIPTKN